MPLSFSTLSWSRGRGCGRGRSLREAALSARGNPEADIVFVVAVVFGFASLFKRLKGKRH
jgi:hypothetical protein